MPKTEKAGKLRKNVKLGKKWRWCPLATDSRGRLVGDVVLVNGRRETYQEGQFAVFWKEGGKNPSEPAGTDFTEARSALRRRQARLNTQLAGVVMPAEPASKSRVRLEDAADDFLAEVKTQRERKTLLADRSMRTDFLAACGKAHLDEIERRALIDFVAYLKTKERGKETKGMSDRTIYNKFELLMSFLKAKGILMGPGMFEPVGMLVFGTIGKEIVREAEAVFRGADCGGVEAGGSGECRWPS